MALRPRPEYYEAWHRATPPGFVFAVKGPRYITHMLRLTNIEKPLANFFCLGIPNKPSHWRDAETSA